jgi:hypothetical protein
MDKFEITLDHKRTGTKLIECKSKGLVIMVLPRKHRAELAESNTIEVTASWYDMSLKGDDLLNSQKLLRFWVLNANTEKSINNGKELFLDAIDFYCNEYLKKPHHGLSVVPSLLWEAYGTEGEDDFSCLDELRDSDNGDKNIRLSDLAAE